MSTRYLGPLFAGLELGLVLYILIAFDSDRADLQFKARYTVLPGLEWLIGMDGTGILFIAVTALLFFFLALYGMGKKTEPSGADVSTLLGFEALLMGLFTTQNLLLFGCLSVLELIPIGFLLKAHRSDAASRPGNRLYWQFMVSGLFLLWAGIVLLGWHHAHVAGFWSFALDDLQRTPLPETLQRITFVLIFYSCAIRLAQFPLHTWLTELAKHPLNPSFVILLVGTKVGLYALLRFVLPLLPDAVHDFRPLVAGLGVVGIFYAAILALMQIRLHRLLAFALVSNTGMLLVGIFSLNTEGLSGSLLLSFNTGLAAAGLFISADSLLRRTRTALLPRLNGLFDPLPLVAIMFLLSSLSSMAMPGTPGFDAAHLLLEGAIEAHEWSVTIAVAVGNVLSTAFLLYAFQRIFLTKKRETSLRVVHEQLYVNETLLTGLICLILLGVGFYVEPWMDLIEATNIKLAEPYRKFTP